MDLKVTYARWRLGNLRSEELVDAATDALSAGCDSTSMVQLAGLSAVDLQEARTLFERACAELGVPSLSEEEAARLLTRHLAMEITSGALDPEEGLGQFVREVDAAAGLGWIAPELNELSHYQELRDVPDSLRPPGGGSSWADAIKFVAHRFVESSAP